MSGAAIRWSRRLVPVAVIVTLGVAVADDKSPSAVLELARDALARIDELWESAKKEKDLIRLNCITDKRTDLKGLLRVVEIAVQNLKEAQERKDEEAIAHEKGKIDVAAVKAKQLKAQAETCAGEIARYTGPIDIKVEMDPKLTGEGDPTLLELVKAPELMRPNSASPYQ